MTEILKFVFGRPENIVEKKEKMLVTSIFSFSNNVFKKLLSRGHKKLGLFVKRLRTETLDFKHCIITTH